MESVNTLLFLISIFCYSASLFLWVHLIYKLFFHKESRFENLSLKSELLIGFGRLSVFFSFFLVFFFLAESQSLPIDNAQLKAFMIAILSVIGASVTVFMFFIFKGNKVKMALTRSLHNVLMIFLYCFFGTILLALTVVLPFGVMSGVSVLYVFIPLSILLWFVLPLGLRSFLNLKANNWLQYGLSGISYFFLLIPIIYDFSRFLF